MSRYETYHNVIKQSLNILHYPIAESLCLDKRFEQNLYYTLFDTEDKQKRLQEFQLTRQK